jgi:hypothetical protein
MAATTTASGRDAALAAWLVRLTETAERNVAHVQHADDREPTMLAAATLSGVHARGQSQ